MERKIRVLRIINRFNLGGPTYNAAYLSKYLGEAYETKLIGGDKDESEASSTYIVDHLGLDYEIVPEMKRSIHPINDFRALQKVKAIIKEFKPDIVHTHASKAGTIGRLAAVQCNVPVIVHTFHGHVFHSYFGRAKTSFYKAIERYLARKSSAIVAISNQQQREISLDHQICPSEKMVVIPLGFDLSRFQTNQQVKREDFRRHYQLKEGEIAVVIVGRLVPIKQHGLFLDAAKTVMDRGHRHIRFFIVGDGESRADIEAHARSLGINFTENTPPSADTPLCFTSWIKHVDWVYAGADVVCLSSLNEGTPVSLIEAQAAGRAIVSTKVGGIEDITLPGASALLVARDDATAFADALEQLCTNDELRNRMSQAGIELATTKFSYQRLVQDMTSLYTSLLSKNSAHDSK